jgi:hypothetical protein
MHQINRVFLKAQNNPNKNKKKFEIFEFFLSILIKPTFSSVFRWLSFEPTFEKIEAHFFSKKFSRDLEKFIFFVWGRNLTKTLLRSF